MRSILAAVALLSVALAAEAAPPYKYYVLAPEQLSADLSVMSLEPGNTVSVGSIQMPLGEYARATLPATALVPGAVISGSAQYSVGSTGDATDLLAPDFFAGTSFIIPHISGDHRYYVQATTATANVTVRLGASTQSLQLTPGTAYEVEAGSDSAISGLIDSDQPIVVAHVTDVSASPRQAYPVPPASTELVGVRSQSVVIGANTNGTSVTVYTSDGASTVYSLNAGEKVDIAIGASDAQGAGASVHLVSNYPVAAVQYDDGDGDDASAFWPTTAFAKRYGIPINAQYVAVACLQASVTVRLFKGSGAPETQTCTATGNTPGKVYFGAGTSGNNLGAGWYLNSSAPVYAMYEAAASEDEHNISGAQSSSGPAAPTLGALPVTTTSNPLAVSGTAPANASVRLFVNGVHQQTTTASGAGAYAFNAELSDGNNVVYAVAVSGAGDESDPSNVEQVAYTNTFSRTQSGSISASQVWTPGSPATPYVISGTLTVAAGAKLVLQPGTTLKFANNTSLTVNGTLKIAGTSDSPVTLTSNAASPSRGIWTGIVINANSGPTEISNALIDWPRTGVLVNGVSVTIRNSTIRRFLGGTENGIHVIGAGASGTQILWNTIQGVNGEGSGVWSEASSPTIRGNTVTGTDKGVNVTNSGAPLITENLITNNDSGIWVKGLGGTPLPVANGNRIYDNSIANYGADATFPSGSHSVRLNATGNWWGTAEPYLISATISDLTANNTSTTTPVVDYGGYLTSPTGPAATGNWLTGVLSGTTTLETGKTYDVLGVLIVPSGSTLAIPQNVTLRVHPSAAVIRIDGSLQVAGATNSPVTFTSGRATPVRGAWQGILVSSTATTVSIDNAVIEWGAKNVVFNKAGTLTNSILRQFPSGTGTGVYIKGSAASATQISGNTIQGVNKEGRCIVIEDSSPSIANNTLTNSDRAVYVYHTSDPTITGNVITNNDNGIYVEGHAATAQPVATGNQIYSNGWNFYVTDFATGAQNLKLNATGNWWGTTDPTTISAGIFDLLDNRSNPTTFPTVDYSDYLDGPGGAPVPGNYLIGPLVATSTTLTSGVTYDVLGDIVVPSGKTLIVPAGVVMRFHAGTYLTVDGTLSIQGSSSSMVTLTSGKPAPANGDWRGVVVRSTATNVTLDYVVIEWTTRAVEVQSTNAVITNSILRRFSTAGIAMTGSGTGSTIANNLIDNFTQIGDGINLSSSSPTINENRIHRTNRGIYLSGASNPVITRNLLQNNKTGIFLFGNNSNSATAVPQPTINENDIFGNTVVQMEVNAYGASNPAVINATGNWWGTATPIMGTQLKVTSGTLASAVDFSSPASGKLTDDMGVPTPPTTITATANSDSQITVSWSGATDDFGVVSYAVERCVGAGCADFAQIGSVSTTSFVDTGRTASTTYNYRVQAFDAVPHASLYSSVAAATTLADGQAPAAPTTLDVAGVSGNQVHLVWTAATDNMGVAVYLIERCQGSGCSSFTLIGTSRKPSFWSTGLTISSTYSFRVRAQDRAANFSPYSNVKSATTTLGGEDCD